MPSVTGTIPSRPISITWPCTQEQTRPTSSSERSQPPGHLSPPREPLATRGLRMKSILALFAALSVLLPSPALAQNQFYVTFRGTAWRTNNLGHLTPNPLSEQDLLLAAAQAWGRTDATGLFLVYHVQGNGLGDTIDVVDSSNGTGFYLNYFGFYFGEATQSTPDRVALTNSTGTQVRRIDHIYTQTATLYTSPNPGGHDM